MTINSADVADISAVIPAPTAGALAVRNALRVPEGLEEFGAKDMIVPDLKIGQGTSRDKDVVPGKFYNSLAVTERYDKLRLTLLSFRHGQVFFPRKPDGKPDYDADVVCRSDDGRVPSTSIEKPISPRCTDEKGEYVCPAGKWDDSGKKPSCAATYNLLVADVDSGLAFRFSVSGTSIPTVKKFLSALMMRAKAQGRSAFDYEFTLGNTKEVNADASYYVPTFQEITPVEINKHRALYQLYSRVPVNSDAKPEAKGPVVDSAAKGEAAKPKDLFTDAPTTSGAPKADAKTKKGKEALEF